MTYNQGKGALRDQAEAAFWQERMLQITQQKEHVGPKS